MSSASTSLAIEVLGPPGAGKSELALAIRALNRDVDLVHTYFRFKTLIPWMSAGVQLLPLLGTSSTGNRAIKGRAWMIRLEASSTILRRARRRSSILIFDQGPLFTIARLREAVPQKQRTARWEQWLADVTSTWAQLLDVVLLLDATDEELLNRISARPKKHFFEDYARSRARERLNHNRLLYQRVVEELQRHGDLRVVRIDTSKATVDQAVANATAALGLGFSHGHGSLKSSSALSNDADSDRYDTEAY